MIATEHFCVRCWCVLPPGTPWQMDMHSQPVCDACTSKTAAPKLKPVERDNDGR